MRLTGYMAGVNLGHWISQYGDKSFEHFNSYIKESDFERMAQWGLDHVRVPVDYMTFEKDENPGVYLEEGLKYVDFALECCKKYGLNMVLDLHRTPGFTFGFKLDKEKNNLFVSRSQQERFINIWKNFAVRYKNEGDNIMFELLNELVLEETAPWNKLWQETAGEIFKITPNRKIVIGSNLWNSVEQLENLEIVDNPNIIYNFHCYAPFIFTHQRAGWEERMMAYQKAVVYPVKTKEHEKFFVDNDKFLLENYEVIDKKAMYDFLKPAVEFIEKNNRPLYCGEYGVISRADDESAVRWLDDITAVFNEYGIGHAVWSYRGFSSITSEDNKSFNNDMVKMISRH